MKSTTTTLPARIRYAADNKNYACLDGNCKAHHDAEYVLAADYERLQAEVASLRGALQSAVDHESGWVVKARAALTGKEGNNG